MIAGVAGVRVATWGCTIGHTTISFTHGGGLAAGCVPAGGLVLAVLCGIAL